MKIKKFIVFNEYKKSKKCSECKGDMCESDCKCDCHKTDDTEDANENKKIKKFDQYIKEYGVETEEEIETEVEIDNDEDDMGMPSPFPTKKPSVDPAPKAQLEDVIKRTKELYDAKKIKRN
jgi:hypothetical protein